MTHFKRVKTEKKRTRPISPTYLSLSYPRFGTYPLTAFAEPSGRSRLRHNRHHVSLLSLSPRRNPQELHPAERVDTRINEPVSSQHSNLNQSIAVTRTGVDVGIERITFPPSIRQGISLPSPSNVSMTALPRVAFFHS